MSDDGSDILRAALRRRFPSVWSRVFDEWKWSVSAFMVSGCSVLLEYALGIPVHEAAPALAGGVTALAAIAVSASLVAVPAVIGGEYRSAKDPRAALERVVAVVWNNVVWVIWIASVTICLSVTSLAGPLVLVGALVPGLALLAIVRTYIATQETFRVYVALVIDRFDVD